MTEGEYVREVLCTCYSMQTLEKELAKRKNGLWKQVKNTSDMIDVVTERELDDAIFHYNEKSFQKTREELDNDRMKYGI